MAAPMFLQKNNNKKNPNFYNHADFSAGNKSSSLMHYTSHPWWCKLSVVHRFLHDMQITITATVCIFYLFICLFVFEPEQKHEIIVHHYKTAETFISVDGWQRSNFWSVFYITLLQ